MNKVPGTLAWVGSMAAMACPILIDASVFLFTSKRNALGLPAGGMVDAYFYLSFVFAIAGAIWFVVNMIRLLRPNAKLILWVVAMFSGVLVGAAWALFVLCACLLFVIAKSGII